MPEPRPKQNRRPEPRKDRKDSFRGSGRRFCFGRGSGIPSMFWASVVQVEQMNKKGPYAYEKKLPTESAD